MPSGSPSIKHCDVWAMCSSMWSRSRASQEHQTCCKHAADLHGVFCAFCLWLLCLLLAVTCGWQMLSLCPGIRAHQIAWRQLSGPWVRHGHLDLSKPPRSCTLAPIPSLHGHPGEGWGLTPTSPAWLQSPKHAALGAPH